jgi:hypothetical protein
MLSQYYLIVDTNTLSGQAATHSSRQDGLLLLKEVQKALSLSLNLYALAEQESKVRLLSLPQPSQPLISSPSNPALISPLELNNPFSIHYKNIKSRKNSSSNSAYFSKDSPDYPKAVNMEG